jgi:hypothetical protein
MDSRQSLGDWKNCGTSFDRFFAFRDECGEKVQAQE